MLLSRVSAACACAARLRLLVTLAALILLGRAGGIDVAQAQGRPSAQAVTRIHVRGGAEIHALATSAHDEVSVHGEVIDDSGTPIAGAQVVIGGAGGAITGARPCGDVNTTPARVAPHPSETTPGAVTLETDDRGGFCFVGKATSAKASLTARFPGKGLYDPCEATIPIEPAEEHRTRAVLRFEPPIEAIELDREMVLITASLRVDRSDAERAAAGVSGSAQRASLPLVLTDERGAHVADALTGGDGRARFEVKTSALAGPGAGELTVRFAGNGALESATWSQPVVRRAEAKMSLVHPIAPADSEDGIPIDVEVVAGQRPVAGGVIEVQKLRRSFGGHRDTDADGSGDDGNLSAAPVDESGHAHIVVAFPSVGASHATLMLHYLPSAPWYRAGPTLQVDAPLVRTGVGRTILFAMLVVAAGTWVVVGWRRAPPRPLEPGVEASAAVATGVPGVRVVTKTRDHDGWSGTIVDAHDGAPIADATLTIVMPAFEGDGVQGTTNADESGKFVLGALDVRAVKDAKLVIETGTHAKYEQALPPPGVLVIALITRRRALLDRLVKWARRKGPPFDAALEATPGHVRRVASRANERDVEAWASHMEDAVYGARAVDAQLERDVRDREPRS